MTKNTYLIIGVALVLVIVGFVLVEQGGKNEALAPTGEEVSVATSPVVESAAKTVTYTDNGFSPAALTIKEGETVTFKNDSGKDFWPASGPHPTHTNYPEFDAKQTVASGGTWSFTFSKKGVWKYHNHLNPTLTGTVTVQ